MAGSTTAITKLHKPGSLYSRKVLPPSYKGQKAKTWAEWILLRSPLTPPLPSSCRWSSPSMSLPPLVFSMCTNLCPIFWEEKTLYWIRANTYDFSSPSFLKKTNTCVHLDFKKGILGGPNSALTKARLDRGQVTPPSSELPYTHAQSDSSQQPLLHTKPQLTSLREGRGLAEQLGLLLGTVRHQ